MAYVWGGGGASQSPVYPTNRAVTIPLQRRPPDGRIGNTLYIAGIQLILDLRLRDRGMYVYMTHTYIIYAYTASAGPLISN